MKIALDAMGGDFAPQAVIAGAKWALEELDSISKLYLVGDESLVRSELDKISFAHRKLEIVHSAEVIGMDESPVKALRLKKKSSVGIATDLVKDGTCAAVVSAGNTGAAVAAATLKLRHLAGVERAGIAAPLPNDHGPLNIVDAGANPEAKPRHLLQYAIMGSVFARHVQGKQNPVVGLMSVGEEDTKGTEFTREVFSLLKASPLNFIGNVEGHDLFETPLDVLVCDGFVGNIVLKSCEATAKAVLMAVKEHIGKSFRTKIGGLLAKPAFKPVLERLSYDTYGGSPLLGVKGVCIIAHGSSSPKAIKNAIRVALESVQHEVNPHIEEEIAKHG